MEKNHPTLRRLLDTGRRYTMGIKWGPKRLDLLAPNSGFGFKQKQHLKNVNVSKKACFPIWQEKKRVGALLFKVHFNQENTRFKTHPVFVFHRDVFFPLGKEKAKFAFRKSLSRGFRI